MLIVAKQSGVLHHVQEVFLRLLWVVGLCCHQPLVVLGLFLFEPGLVPVYVDPARDVLEQLGRIYTTSCCSCQTLLQSLGWDLTHVSLLCVEFTASALLLVRDLSWTKNKKVYIHILYVNICSRSLGPFYILGQNLLDIQYTNGQFSLKYCI